jgi:hypothetical protein
MGERKLERILEVDRRFCLYGFPLQGFSLKFISGPDMTKEIKPGSLLDTWEIVDGKRRFGFGSQKSVSFTTKEAAIDARTELKRAVDVIAEVVELE